MATPLTDFLSGVSLLEGETKRVSCPVCGGHNTFTVSRVEGRVLYNCYKASCGTRGSQRKRMSVSSLQDKLSGVSSSSQPKNIKERVFSLPDTMTLCTQNDACLEYVDAMNIQASIDAGYCHVFYDFRENRCVFLILGDNGEVAGAVGRALDKGTVPKWKRYDKRKDLMFICGPKQGTAVLVEDCASACTVFAAGYTGVAILGTSLNEYHILKLRVFDKVIVALDADASNKSIQMQKMLAPHVSSELLFLTDDLKYFTPCTVKSLLTK